MQSELYDSPGLVLCRQAICLPDGQNYEGFLGKVFFKEI